MSWPEVTHMEKRLSSPGGGRDPGHLVQQSCLEWEADAALPASRSLAGRGGQPGEATRR